ncbi:MAG: protein-L-isoaspartate(D-aspartate) O-methyltransferase [Desulfobacterales bacterium]|nr:protein-L-isoaspartate(D-aspartate) O-methyltransferase [Desulfobacterales bacterium]MDD4073184.1 protein-L-isoaspartate(D-aspartate) O-methyltransferase [Desulfobacterales bacterium]MDD4393639.1 protein-L-isoaspartate(D-aspartate) O-methyltransferase [Desulfobacterales bacterium]
MKQLIISVLTLLFFGSYGFPLEFTDSPEFRHARKNMVSRQIRARGITDINVLRAMSEVPRHLFVPDELAHKAYSDSPLPIGGGQTISQPYIVALMTESLGLCGNERVLEIGTGSGYQAAVLENIVRDVYSIEIREALYRNATLTLRQMKSTHVKIRHGDGYFGWEDAAPFDCIMITAAIDHIPPPLLKQLKNNGRLILPLGNPFSYQNLTLVTRHDDDYSVRQITGVLFVPMTGQALEKKD